jgi:HSP20 family protein
MNFDSLFDDFRRLEREMDTVFRSRPSIRAAARGSFPAVNVGSTPEAVQVYLFAPGINASDLDLSIEKNLLTIVGERKLPQLEAATEDAGYHLRERFGGGFRRVLSLPDDVDPERVEARYQDGVLQVTLTRRESARPRQIEVKNA